MAAAKRADSKQHPPSVSISKALASASSLVLLQFCSRIFTFILNQALVRLVSPQVFGTAAIQFELLLSTILFLSREGFRNALLRTPTAKEASKDHRALTDNIAALPVLIGMPAALLISLVYVNAASLSTTSQSHFYASVTLYAMAAALELLSEPLYIRAQNDVRVDLRVKAEGIAVIMKTLITFVILVTGSANVALLAFAAGQAAYSLALLGTYMRDYKQPPLFWPHKVVLEVHGKTETRYFDPGLLHLSAAMSGQSVVKHFLTEGDKFLVSRLSPLADQGGYAIASNYGSLAARIVFQPIEETSRLFFSKTLSSSKDMESLRVAANVLSGVLLLFTHLLLLLVTFGPPYLALAVSLVLPQKYQGTSAPAILGVYIYYIPMMAFNGVLEAFFASVSSPEDLGTQSKWMFGFSFGYIFGAITLAKGLGLGDTGLVWANVVNLLFRAIYAWMYARRFFAARGGRSFLDWQRVVPPLPVLVTFVASAVITRWSEMRSRDIPLQLGAQAGHVALGMCGVVACVVTCAVFERATLLQTVAVLRRR